MASLINKIPKISIVFLMILCSCDFIGEKLGDFYEKKVKAIENDFIGKHYILINSQKDSTYLDFREQEVYIDSKRNFDCVSWQIGITSLSKLDFFIRIGYDYFEISKKIDNVYVLNFDNQIFRLLEATREIDVNELEGLWVDELFLGHLYENWKGKPPPPLPPIPWQYCLDSTFNMVPHFKFESKICEYRRHCDKQRITFSINNSLGLIRFHKNRHRERYYFFRDDLWWVQKNDGDTLIVKSLDKNEKWRRKKMIKLSPDMEEKMKKISIKNEKGG